MYTKQQLMNALVSIMGEQAVLGYHANLSDSFLWGKAVKDAGATAYFKQYPEDSHSTVLRDANNDLQKDGWLHFVEMDV